MVESEHAEGNDEEDRVLSVLRSATKVAPPSTKTAHRQAYENRLLTFKAATYYAKPACLSPMICSRFGWCNADQDMLACSSCKEALAITLHSNLSVKALEKICKVYRQQLGTAHEQDCPFRLDAEQYLRLEEAQCKKTVVPIYMVSVFPQECVELMEHPSPTSILRQHVKQLENMCLSLPSTEARWRYPKLEISQEIRSHRISDQDASRDGYMLISDISGSLGTNDHSVVTLAILGWTPINQASETDTDTPIPVVSLGCPICLSLMELRLEKRDESSESKEDTEDEPLLKKQKKLAMFCNPHEAHRHYCPYKSGFPKTISAHDTPIWKILLSRLHREREPKEANRESGAGTAADSDKSYDKIRKILWSAIAPKKVDLSEDLEKED